MNVKCCYCEKVLKEKYVRKSVPEKSRCRRCNISWLRRTICSMENDVSMMRIRLKQCLGRNPEDYEDESTDYESDSDSDSDYTEYDGETLKGAKAYDSEEEHFYLDNINGI